MSMVMQRIYDRICDTCRISVICAFILFTLRHAELFSESATTIWADVSEEFSFAQEGVSNTATGPSVRVSPPKPILFISNGSADKVLVRIVQDTQQLSQKVLNATICSFPEVLIIPGRYPDEHGAYVNLAEIDSSSHLPIILDPSCSIEKKVQMLKRLIENKQLPMPNNDQAPMLITDATDCPPTPPQTLLLLTPWNFQGASRALYTPLVLENMLLELYYGFRAYKQLFQQKYPHRLASINTGPWGVRTMRNNPLVVAILQILAGAVAGIDELRFYYGRNASDQQFKNAVDKGLQFIKCQAGKSVEEALQSLFTLVTGDSTLRPEKPESVLKDVQKFYRPKESQNTLNRP